MEELKNCPICNNEEFEVFLNCKDYTVSQNSFKIVVCKNCGFHFTNPRPTEQEIGRYYQSDDYISHSNTKKGVVNTLYQFVRNYTIGRKYKLIRKWSANNHVLDYGCGTGEFLNYCREQGMKTHGYEPSRAREQAKEYGVNILSWEEIKEIEEESIGVITMWHVLEHVHRLKETVEVLIKKLHSSGTLIVAVPNMSSWDARHYKEHWAAYDVPRHLYHFTPINVNQLFLQYGLETKQILPMKFDAFYVSLLSEKYKSGSQNLVKGFLNGLRSNFRAKPTTYSSQIYILKKS